MGKNHTDQKNQHKAGSKSNHKTKEDNPFDPNEKKTQSERRGSIHRRR